MHHSPARACRIPSTPARCAYRAAVALLVGAGIGAVRWEAALHAADATSAVPASSELLAWSELTLAERRSLRDVYSRPPEQWPAPVVEPTVEWREMGLLPPAPHRDDNPCSDEKAALGRRLFFDRRLSGCGQLSCATCHDPQRAWSNAHERPHGNPLWDMPRDPPGLISVGHRSVFHWDGAASSLEEQAVLAVQSPRQMGAPPEHVERRLADNDEYRQLFHNAFADGAVTLENAAKALAVYQRTLSGGTSYFDDFLRGQRMALSDEALYGLHLFRTDARCMNCHHGPNLTDEKFHGMGLSYFGRKKYEDLGRYYMTGDPADSGRFRTPSLRDVGRTGPHMHRGMFSLQGVVNMLSHGMPEPKQSETDGPPDPLRPRNSPLLRPLNLSPTELTYVRMFLESLSERTSPKP